MRQVQRQGICRSQTWKVKPAVRDRQPIFNVPWPVLALLGAMIAMHLVRLFLNEDQAYWLLAALAFIPARYSEASGALPGGEMAKATSFVTHLFLHADKIHLAVNGAWLLAFGTPLAKRLGWLRFMLFTMCCGAAGATTFLALHPGLMAPVIGASGAIAGLMGGVMRLLFPALDSHEGYLLQDHPQEIEAMPLLAALRDKRVLLSSAAFVALNVLAMFGLGSPTDSGVIAWEAHLGGYFFGLLCFDFFDAAVRLPSSTTPRSPSESP